MQKISTLLIRIPLLYLQQKNIY